MASAPGSTGFRDLDREQRLGFIRAHGSHTLAYSTLQDGIQAHAVDNVGYVGFAEHGRLKRVFVLSDPVCRPEGRQELIESFLERFPDPIWVQVSAQVGSILHARGFFVNEFGIETDIPLGVGGGEYRIGWGTTKGIKRMSNLARRAGVVVKEQPLTELDIDRLRAISAEWIGRKTSSRSEMAFLARPMALEEEPGVRRFFEYLDGEVIGFAFFSPLYRAGELIGYYLDHHRHIRENRDNDPTPKRGTALAELRARGIFGSPIGMSYLTTVEAIRAFQAEGRELLALGFSPLHGISDSGAMHSASTKQLFRLFHFAADWLYHNSGNYEFKKRWHGVEKKVYWCARRPFSLRPLLECYRLCRVF